MAARFHHQLERAGRREGNGDDVRRLLQPLAQAVPTERDLALDLEEQRAPRFAERRAQHEVRDRLAIRDALEEAQRLLELER